MARAYREAGVPIRIYANDVFVEYDETLDIIPIDGNEPHTITVTIPDEIPDDFLLVIVVDDNGNGGGDVVDRGDPEIPVVLAEEELVQPPGVVPGAGSHGGIAGLRRER